MHATVSICYTLTGIIRHTGSPHLMTSPVIDGVAYVAQMQTTQP